MANRLCALSVDLDEVHHYRGLHGLPARVTGATAVYDVAVDRLTSLARETRVPVTWFAVGEDLERESSRARLRRLAAHGDAVENHSQHHRYDFGRLRGAELRGEVEQAHERITACTGRAPVGFRAPGYARTGALLDLLAELGYRFDSSLLPSPAYYAVKASIMARLRAGGRRSSAVLGDPREVVRSAAPHRARPARRPGGPPLMELPIQVLPWLRVPVIGTSLVLAGLPLARWIVAACGRAELINLELHGIDALEPADGLADLNPAQPDLVVPVQRKLDVLRGVLDELQRRGYQFVTLEQAATRLAG